MMMVCKCHSVYKDWLPRTEIAGRVFRRDYRNGMKCWFSFFRWLDKYMTQVIEFFGWLCHLSSLFSRGGSPLVMIKWSKCVGCIIISLQWHIYKRGVNWHGVTSQSAEIVGFKLLAYNNGTLDGSSSFSWPVKEWWSLHLLKVDYMTLPI